MKSSLAIRITPDLFNILLIEKPLLAALPEFFMFQKILIWK